MNFFRRYRILRKANYLELTPIRMHEHSTGEDGRVTLIVPKFRNPLFSRWLIPSNRSKAFNIHLDELGSATWLEIDNNSRVRDICDRLIMKYGEKVQPVEQRVTKFLTLLYDQRYISFKEISN
jgi:hypothetical protein